METELLRKRARAGESNFPFGWGGKGEKKAVGFDPSTLWRKFGLHFSISSNGTIMSG